MEYFSLRFCLLYLRLDFFNSFQFRKKKEENISTMDSPMNVIGASSSSANNTNRQRSSMPPTSTASSSSSSSYHNQQHVHNDTSLNNNYNNPDLYEFDANSEGNGHSKNQYKRDIIDILCGQINQSLLIPKTFYFFFFAAFGSLFPMMAIYFKQMGMNPTHVGFLFGLKPFVEFISAPFWVSVGERWKQAKLILLFSLICWIGFTLGLGFIHPPVHSCLMHNQTHLFLSKAASGSDHIKVGSEETKRKHHKRSVIDSSLQLLDADSSTSIYPSLLKVVEKRAIENHEKVFRIVNVTRIVKVRKTTTQPPTKEVSTEEIRFTLNADGL